MGPRRPGRVPCSAPRDRSGEWDPGVRGGSPAALPETGAGNGTQASGEGPLQRSQRPERGMGPRRPGRVPCSAPRDRSGEWDPGVRGGSPAALPETGAGNGTQASGEGPLQRSQRPERGMGPRRPGRVPCSAPRDRSGEWDPGVRGGSPAALPETGAGNGTQASGEGPLQRSQRPERGMGPRRPGRVPCSAPRDRSGEWDPGVRGGSPAALPETGAGNGTQASGEGPLQRSQRPERGMGPRRPGRVPCSAPRDRSGEWDPGVRGGSPAALPETGAGNGTQASGERPLQRSQRPARGMGPGYLNETIRNAMKIRDVTKCLEEFELLGKAYGKAKSIVDKEGVPRFYIRILADLEQYLNEEEEEEEDSDSDDEDWGSSDSDTDSESDEDDGKYTSLASKFLKKDEDKKSTEKKREEKAKKKHDRKAKKDEDEEDEGGEWEKVKGGAPLVKEKPKMFAKGTEINHAVVVKKLNEILQARGKKGTDRCVGLLPACPGGGVGSAVSPSCA
ncbi:Eukaryotic translation initiation factor 3 subunit C [Chelonia mydas]|uniref:Eukaryotic translation initiation factor 3 subunit C n=1 Tax=Chelonia mydas TaxID=8469 RepID=M7BQG9_CHEMY|nr:Eukaryotic translation initiation factor 3 subunit C [Chelonia mydas]